MPFFSLPTGGSPVLAGSGAPTGALGNIGDLFIDTSNKLLYGPKAVGGWPSGPVDLSNGPTGSTGPTAPATLLSLGTVATGTSAAVSLTGVAPNQTLSFVIPAITGPTGASIVGPTGSTGATAPFTSLSVGTVTTGITASVSITGTAPNQTLSFVIPSITGPSGASIVGPTGATGATAPATNLSIGTVSTGVSASVTITGTAPNQTLSFVIPAITGPSGASIVGPTGAQGAASTVTGPTGEFPFAATGPTAPSVSLAGSVWLDDTTGKYFVRYDANWIEIGVQGERGPTGSTGPASTVTGPTGGVGAASTVTGPTGGVGSFSDAQSINAQTTGYTLSLSDAGKLVTLNASTGTINVVIPPASSVAFATGTHVDMVRIGAAAVTVTGATGVTVNATPGSKLRAQYSAGTAILYAGNTWLVVGDLS
jgi:hypothetical protein